MKKILWDVAPKEINTLSIDFVIERALSYGGVIFIAKLINKHGKDKVRQIFERMKPTSISTKKYLYLKNFLLV